jgi:hypothetical protein
MIARNVALILVERLPLGRRDRLAFATDECAGGECLEERHGRDNPVPPLDSAIIGPRTHPTLRPYLLGAAGIAILAAAIWVCRIDSLRASHKADATNVRREYTLFREQVEAKAAQALIAQKAVNAVQEQKWKDEAHAADQKHETELAAANAAAERHIRDNRLLRQAVDRGAGGEAGGAAQGDSAQDSYRSGEAADLVAVTADDVRVCTENTRRLIDVRDWALGLER